MYQEQHGSKEAVARDHGPKACIDCNCVSLHIVLVSVEDRNGQVGYAPAGFLVVILDTTAEEQESDATKKGQENSTEENRIGQEGERRKSYSAAVIDGMKRNTTIYVGDSSFGKQIQD